MPPESYSMKGDVHIDQGGGIGSAVRDSSRVGYTVIDGAGIGLDSRLVVDGISSTDPFCLAIMRTI
jgi:hypothetical protein